MNGVYMIWRWVTIWMICATTAQAELQSLFPRTQQGEAQVVRASLFSGPEGLFEPFPEPAVLSARPMIGANRTGTGDTAVDELLSLIAAAEAGPMGYDAVQYGARVRPTKRPSDMTLGEIYDWIAATPGQPHAIGRYQFIPPTLRRVAAERGFGPQVQFTPGVQDALALVLLEDAGLTAFRDGDMSRLRFMHNLARIWAGLPLPNGRSYYDGHAGNAATLTWAAFDGGMRAIWGG